MHFRYHANSEYKLHVGVDQNGVEFVHNTFTHSHMYYCRCGLVILVVKSSGGSVM